MYTYEYYYTTYTNCFRVSSGEGSSGQFPSIAFLPFSLPPYLCLHPLPSHSFLSLFPRSHPSTLPLLKNPPLERAGKASVLLDNYDGIRILVYFICTSEDVNYRFPYCRKEMSVLKKICWLRALMISCVKLNTKIAIFFSILAYIYLQNDLTAAKVFVIFYYYENLKYTLVDFLPMAITFVLEAYVSVKRMQEFLLLPEVNNQDGVDLLVIDEEGAVSHTNGLYEKVETE